MNNRTIVPMLASVALLALGAALPPCRCSRLSTRFLHQRRPRKAATSVGSKVPTGGLAEQLAQAGGAGRPGAPI